MERMLVFAVLGFIAVLALGDLFGAAGVCAAESGAIASPVAGFASRASDAAVLTAWHFLGLFLALFGVLMGLVLLVAAWAERRQVVSEPHFGISPDEPPAVTHARLDRVEADLMALQQRRAGRE